MGVAFIMHHHIPLIKSPLNYIGGKFKILPQIYPHFPQKIEKFIDVFAGGANVAININATKIYVNDNLVNLIELYKKLQTLSIDEVFNHIYQQINEFNLSLVNENGYKKLRQHYNRCKNPLDLLILISYSFNHQIRFNNSNEFNNPFGKNRSQFNDTMARNLKNFMIRLHQKNIEFSALNFDVINFSQFGEDDFVYCDPPYLITTGAYNDGKRGFTGWNAHHELLLLKLLSDLNERNIKFALSNVLNHKGNENTILMDWINNHHNLFVYNIKSDYSNANYQNHQNEIKPSHEVLITNYAQPKIPIEFYQQTNLL